MHERLSIDLANIADRTDGSRGAHDASDVIQFRSDSRPRRRVGDVEREHAVPTTRKRTDQLCESPAVTGAHRDGMPVVSQPLGHNATDAAGGAGDQYSPRAAHPMPSRTAS